MEEGAYMAVKTASPSWGTFFYGMYKSSLIAALIHTFSIILMFELAIYYVVTLKVLSRVDFLLLETSMRTIFISCLTSNQINLLLLAISHVALKIELGFWNLYYFYPRFEGSVLPNCWNPFLLQLGYSTLTSLCNALVEGKKGSWDILSSLFPENGR